MTQGIGFLIHSYYDIAQFRSTFVNQVPVLWKVSPDLRTSHHGNTNAARRIWIRPVAVKKITKPL